MKGAFKLDKRNKRITLAVVGALVSTWLIYSGVTSAKEEETTYVNVIEIAKDVAQNEQLTPDHLKEAQVPEDQYQNWMLKDKTQAIGKYAAFPMYEGDKLRTEKLTEKQTVVFGPQDRMMNVEMEVADFGGLPEETEYADILAYFPPPEKGMGVGHSELVLENVYIQHLITSDGAEVEKKNTLSEPIAETEEAIEEEVPPIPAIVTLKVTVEQSLILNTYQQNPDVELRLIGRTQKSENTNVMSIVSETLKQGIKYTNPAKQETTQEQVEVKVTESN